MHFSQNEITTFPCAKLQKSNLFLTTVLLYFTLGKPHSCIYDYFEKLEVLSL